MHSLSHKERDPIVNMYIMCVCVYSTRFYGSTKKAAQAIFIALVLQENGTEGIFKRPCFYLVQDGSSL